MAPTADMAEMPFACRLRATAIFLRCFSSERDAMPLHHAECNRWRWMIFTYAFQRRREATSRFFFSLSFDTRLSFCRRSFDVFENHCRQRRDDICRPSRAARSVCRYALCLSIPTDAASAAHPSCSTCSDTAYCPATQRAAKWRHDCQTKNGTAIHL